MLINLAIWRNQSLWSKFRIIFSVEVYTKELCYDSIPAKRLELRNLLYKLSDQGLTNREIADYLESQDIKSPQGKKYSPNLVWVSLKKWRARDLRLAHREVKIGPITVE